MRLILVLLCGLVFWASQLLAAPRLLLLSPTKLRLGFYGTITGEDFSLLLEENQVFVLPQGADEPVSVPVTKVIRVQGSETQMKITFVLSPNVLPEPPRTNVPAEVWVVTKGEESNHLNFTIVPSPAITEVSPPQASPGDEIDVEITTFRTRLRPRGLSLNFGPGIQVSNINVTGPTSLTAHLQIAEDAPLGKRDVILRLGRLVIRGYQLFEVVPPPNQTQALKVEVQELPKLVFTPTVTVKGTVGVENVSPTPPPPPAVITSVIPAAAQQGQRLTLSLTGQNTHFSQEETQVLLGQGITVEALRVQDETHLEVDIYVAPEAEVGPRNIQVITGEEIALSPIAFNIQRGYGVIKGHVRDALTKEPLVHARVSLPDYARVVYTDENGYFEIRNIPSGRTRLYISASNYDGLVLDIDLSAGEELNFTADEKAPGLLMQPIVRTGEIPGTSFEALLSQGLTLLTAPASYEETVEKIKNAIIGLGGSEMGVLDKNGEQLNPEVTGEGIISVKPYMLEVLADYWQMGRTYSLGEVLYFLTYLLEWENDNRPTLGQWLVVLNEVVSDIWSDPEHDSYDLVRFIFSHGEDVPDNPPILTADYRLNPIQAFLFIQAFFINYVEQKEASLIKPSNVLLASLLDNAILSDGFFLLAQNENTDNGTSSGTGESSNIKEPFKYLVRSIKYTFSKENFDAFTDDLSKDFLKNALKGDPQSSKVFKVAELVVQQKWVDLLKFAYSTGRSLFTQAIVKMAEEYCNNKYGKEKCKKLKEQLQVPTIDLAASYAGKIMQVLWQPFIDMYKITIKELASPFPPIIDNVDYNYNEDGEIDGVRITFYGSLTESRVFRLREQRGGKYPKIFYLIFRKDSSGYVERVAFKEAKEFPRNEKGLYYFIDRSAPIGVLQYRMLALIQWRRDPLHVVDFTKDVYYNYAKDIAPLPRNLLLVPLLEDLWSAYAEVSIYLYKAYSTYSNVYSFYNNPYVKFYARLDVAAPPFPVLYSDINGFFSNAQNGKIYALTKDNQLRFWADTIFAPPHQKGLAVDFLNNVYTENAASEDRFAGKIFKFVPVGDQGLRVDRSPFAHLYRYPWIGTIRAWSFFGYSLGFVYPISMADLCYGYFGHPALPSEVLYILEQSYGDIRALPTDGSRRVATKLDRIFDFIPERLPINEFSRCAYSFYDDTLYFSWYDFLFKVDISQAQVVPVISSNGTDGSLKVPLYQIGGFDFDSNGLLYVADFYLKKLFIVNLGDKKWWSFFDLPGNPVDLSLSADKKFILIAFNNAYSGLYVIPKFLPFKIVPAGVLPFEGVVNLMSSDENLIPVRIDSGYILAPITEFTTLYLTKDAKRYQLLFNPDTLQVVIRSLPVKLPTQIDEDVEVKTPPPIEVEGPVNFVQISDNTTYFGSCVAPLLPLESPFIRIVTPLSSVELAPNFMLYAVVSKGISQVDVYFDGQLYRSFDFDNETGGCIEVFFTDVPEGIHLIKFVSNNPRIIKSLPVQVIEEPSSKVLAGIVLDKTTHLPLPGLTVKHSSGNQTEVDSFGIYQLVVDKNADEALSISLERP